MKSNKNKKCPQTYNKIKEIDRIVQIMIVIQSLPSIIVDFTSFSAGKYSGMGIGSKFY